MSATALPSAGAFRDLERRLARRRWLHLEPRMRAELALLALLIAAFLFWQARVPLDGLVRAQGPPAGIAAVAIVLAVLAGLAVPLVAARHARRLRTRPPGPEWLALPASGAALARHLGNESSAIAMWLALPAAGVLAAAAGILSPWWPALLAAAFLLLLRAARDAGAALGLAAAARGLPKGPGAAIVRVLGHAAPASRRRRLPAAIPAWIAAPRWRRMPAWAALLEKDLRLTLRQGPLRRALAGTLALGALSLGVWTLQGDPALRHFVAFALALLTAAAAAQWLVLLSGSDPFAGLRVLPLGLGAVWGARFALGALTTLLLVAGHAIAARDLTPVALRVFLAWTGAASIAIVALAVNYGVTLFPRADIAERLLGLSLGLAMAASVMIPLSGWIVLLAGVVHSARRLPHWSRLEEA
jgi:hypothetical protein